MKWDDGKLIKKELGTMLEHTRNSQIIMWQRTTFAWQQIKMGFQTMVGSTVYVIQHIFNLQSPFYNKQTHIDLVKEWLTGTTRSRMKQLSHPIL